MNRLYLKIGTTGLGTSKDGLSDEVLQVCYAWEKDGKFQEPVLQQIKPRFRSSWPEVSMINGIWPENVVDKPYFRDVRSGLEKMLKQADEVVMDNGKFTRNLCTQAGLNFPEGKKYIDLMDCYTKEHPELLAEGAKRLGMQDVAIQSDVFVSTKSEISKVEAMHALFNRLKNPEQQNVEELGGDNGASYKRAKWRGDVYRKAEELCDRMEHNDTLFDSVLEEAFYVDEEKKFALRREEIMRAVKSPTTTLRQAEDAMVSFRADILSIETSKDADHNSKMVAYEILGNVYHQSFASEDLDVKISIDKAKAEGKWFKYEYADALKAGKGEFDLSSEAEKLRCLKHNFRYGGVNQFIPDISNMGDATKLMYGIAKQSKGKDSVVYEFDLEYMLGKDWKKMLANDAKVMADPDRNGVSVPLKNVIIPDGSGKVIVRGEILTMFRANKRFYESCNKNLARMAEPFYQKDIILSDKEDGIRTTKENFNVTVLSSGSSANSVLIETKDEKVLLDFGNGIKATNTFLKSKGLSMKDINAVFLTHEHSDHIKFSQSFLDAGPKIFATVGTWQGISEKNKNAVMFVTKNCFVMPEKISFPTGLEVRRIETCHDTKAPCMYMFTKDGQSLVWATDTGRVTESVRKAAALADHLVIEANHDKYLLQKDEAHDEFSKCRVRSEQGHLSNDDTEDLLASLENPPKKIWLAHVSAGSNSPDLINDMVERARKRNPLLDKSSFRVLNQSEGIKVPLRSRALPTDENIEMARRLAADKNKNDMPR